MIMGLVLCAYGAQEARQEGGTGGVDRPAAARTPASVGRGCGRDRGAAPRDADVAGTSLWEGELPMRTRRAAWPLSVSECDPAGSPTANGLCAHGADRNGHRPGLGWV